MKLIEQIDAEYDKADALSGRCDIPRDTLLGWKNEVIQLKAKLEDEEGLKMQAVQEWNRVEAENEDAWNVIKAAHSLEMLLDALGSRHSLRDAGPDLDSLTKALGPFKKRLDALLTAEGPDRS